MKNIFAAAAACILWAAATAQTGNISNSTPQLTPATGKDIPAAKRNQVTPCDTPVFPAVKLPEPVKPGYSEKREPKEFREKPLPCEDCRPEPDERRLPKQFREKPIPCEDCRPDPDAPRRYREPRVPREPKEPRFNPGPDLPREPREPREPKEKIIATAMQPACVCCQEVRIQPGVRSAILAPAPARDERIPCEGCQRGNSMSEERTIAEIRAEIRTAEGVAAERLRRKTGE